MMLKIIKVLTVAALLFVPSLSAQISAPTQPTTYTEVICCMGAGLKRFSITNDVVTTSSQVVGLTIRRPDVENEVDPGWLFNANVVKIANGSFDVLVQLVWEDPEEADPPSGTITLVYQLGS